MSTTTPDRLNNGNVPLTDNARELLAAIGDEIKARATALGQSQERTAKAAQMDGSTLSKIITGKTNASVGVLHRLAEALECDLVVTLKPRKAKR